MTFPVIGRVPRKGTEEPLAHNRAQLTSAAAIYHTESVEGFWPSAVIRSDGKNPPEGSIGIKQSGCKDFR